MSARAGVTLVAALVCAVLAACGGGHRSAAVIHPRALASLAAQGLAGERAGLTLSAVFPAQTSRGQRIPRLLDPRDVYAADRRGGLSPPVRGDRPLIYVPNSASDTVQEIDPRTYRIVRTFKVGAVPQHVIPSYDLRTLWVANDIGNSLTPIDPRDGAPGRPVPVADPYNMYFSPDGRSALVMAEQLRRIDYRVPHTMALRHSLSIPSCMGLNHADFTADGRLMLVSCEFGARMVVVDVARERVTRRLPLPRGASPQDVKLSPDGRTFYVADLTYGGVWTFDARSFRRTGFVRTGAGAHGLYPSRNASDLYVSDRGVGAISVISFATRRVRATWHIPGGGSPDMGGVSASGHVLWLSGRYDAVVYAINTHTGRLIRRIPVQQGPHGLCVWPQPGRYSLGHTGIMR